MTDRTLEIVTHLLGIFTWFIGALVVLLASKDKRIKKHAKEALNWQLSALIYTAISLVLVFVLIGILLLPAIGILNIIFCVIAAIRASEGKVWKYPLAIKFFKV